MREVYLLLLIPLLIPLARSSCLPIPVVQVFIPEFIDPPAPGGAPILFVSSIPNLTLVEGEDASLTLSVSGPPGEEVRVEVLSSPPISAAVSPEILTLGESPSEVSLVVGLPLGSLGSPARRDVRVIFSVDGEPRAEVLVPVTLLRGPRIEVGLSCPEVVPAGALVDLRVRVSNGGDVPAEEVAVLVSSGGRVSLIGSHQARLEVPPQASAEAVFSMRVDGPGSVEVVVRSGEVEHVSSLNISATLPSLSLSAQHTDGGVLLTLVNSGNATASDVSLEFSREVLVGPNGEAVRAIHVGSLGPGASVSYLITSDEPGGVVVSASCGSCEPVEIPLDFPAGSGSGVPLWQVVLLLAAAAGVGMLLGRR